MSLDGVVLGKTLIELAGCSQDGVPISAVVKFIKWAYNYEQWEIYEQLVELLISHIKVFIILIYTSRITLLKAISISHYLPYTLSLSISLLPFSPVFFFIIEYNYDLFALMLLYAGCR